MAMKNSEVALITGGNKGLGKEIGRQLGALVAAMLLASSFAMGCGGSSDAASSEPSGSPPPARPGAYVYTTGYPDLIVRSVDGGHSWKVVHRDLATAASDLPLLMACAFADADHGWAVGRAGTVLTTSDAGASWTAQRTPSSRAILDAVAAVDADHVWAVGREPDSGSGPNGDSAVLWATRDGGATWQAQRLAGASNLRGVAFADARHGWVVGGEDKSVGQFILNSSQYVVKIMQRGQINSLNASVAVGIALFALRDKTAP